MRYAAPSTVTGLVQPDNLARPPGCVHRWRPNGHSDTGLNHWWAFCTWCLRRNDRGFQWETRHGDSEKLKADWQSGRWRCVSLWDFVDNLQRRPFLLFLLRRLGFILRWEGVLVLWRWRKLMLLVPLVCEKVSCLWAWSSSSMAPLSSIERFSLMIAEKLHQYHSCTSNCITFALHLDSFFSAPLIFRLVLSKNRIWLRGRRWSLLRGGRGEESWVLISLLLCTADCLVCSVDACLCHTVLNTSNLFHEMGRMCVTVLQRLLFHVVGNARCRCLYYKMISAVCVLWNLQPSVLIMLIVTLAVYKWVYSVWVLTAEHQFGHLLGQQLPTIYSLFRNVADEPEYCL